MEEIWKPIKNYENEYQVSNLGRIKSLERYDKFNRHIIEKILIPRIHTGGYLRVGLNKKDFYIHRLVAEAFIPNPNDYPQVNHKDENSTNNNVSNLEWCTQKYNVNYGTLKERQRKRMLENNPFKNKHHTEKAKEKMRLAKLGKPSKRKRKVLIDGVEYESIANAMQELKICTKKLYKLLNREKEKGSDM